MRDDPYPARYYGRPVDEPFLSDLIATLPYDNCDNVASAVDFFPRPLPRILLILFSLYLCCALFLIFAVSSYAAPLGSATISAQNPELCLQTTEASAR